MEIDRYCERGGSRVQYISMHSVFMKIGFPLLLRRFPPLTKGCPMLGHRADDAVYRITQVPFHGDSLSSIPNQFTTAPLIKYTIPSNKTATPLLSFLNRYFHPTGIIRPI